ncbi:predicted protein [Sclerotinia sclerotiorum 1980 UF-70]|uniref:Uncharacterized protein n=1 Tax=Sclerotinia sclerotiorum (strain ATCC 18683 / 1980 / Ss-1) TaxID=665079 RepID=A7E5B2_SCLS1|nr:predicted protein [Sclerotinia sclerotiorum 1980 UF-70]EDN91084.1 predicted protein [Sclerotinia sclerotiorum 1980 UF-70]
MPVEWLRDSYFDVTGFVFRPQTYHYWLPNERKGGREIHSFGKGPIIVTRNGKKYLPFAMMNTLRLIKT